MFHLAYLWRELVGPLRLAIAVVPGLAFGVGLAITVSAASDGVRRPPERPAGLAVWHRHRQRGDQGAATAVGHPAGRRRHHDGRLQRCEGVRNQGSCSTGAQIIDNLTSTGYGLIPDNAVNSVAGVRDVARAAGGPRRDHALTLVLVTHDAPSPGGPGASG